MYYKYCVLFWLLLFHVFSQLNAQNLVYNGSFEIREKMPQIGSFENDSSMCPCTSGTGYDDNYLNLKMAKGWNDPISYLYGYKSSSDFFHSCGNDTNNLALWYQYSNDEISSVSVPVSSWMIGYQYARTGEGFTGNASPGPGGVYGEYLQSKLIKILDSSKTYILNFYVVRGNLGAYAIETLGSYLTPNDISFPSITSSLLDSTLIPQVINTNGYIIDSLNWTKIEGEFVANGDEEYITIGNMQLVDYNPLLVDSTAPWLYYATYAYDDVALYEKGAPFWTADAGRDTIICFGDSVQIGTTNVPEQYKAEYFYEWFIAGNEKNIISHLEQPTFTPTTTTTYVLKLTDFKYDKTYDTIRVEVINCTNKPEVIVYPNPAIDWVKFEFNTLLPANTKIQLFDIAGRLVQEQQFNPAADQQELELHLKNLAQGVYGFSVLFDDRRVTSGKIIVLNSY